MNLRTCVKVAWDEHDLLDCAAYFEMVHMALDANASELLLADAPALEEIMSRALADIRTEQVRLSNKRKEEAVLQGPKAKGTRY